MRTRHLGWLAVGHPAQVIVGLFAGAIAIGTALLMLPLATESEGGATFSDAVFTATSAICVTGLVVVDTPTHWSSFGEWVILAMIQLGGLGIMTLASLLTMLLARRMGLRQRLTTLAETGVADLGELSVVLKRILAVTAVAETVGAIVLTAGFAWAHDASLPHAARLGVFHSVSAWNNAGFALFSDNLIGFAGDPLILVPIALLVIVGGLGFPVLVDLRARRFGWSGWSLHTKLTVFGTLTLLGVAAVVITALEWTNPDTLGPLSVTDKVMVGSFSGVMPRTAGFNAIDLGHLESTTGVFHTLLMFIGAGSASTGGGIKVTTFVVLALIVWAEMRGNPDTSAFGRTIPGGSQRQAVTITAAAMAAVFLAVSALLAVNDLPLEDVLFEAFSAFGTVGLSTGVTPLLDETGRAVIVGLMFLGRLGPLTLGTALLFNTRPRKYHLAEEPPLIG